MRRIGPALRVPPDRIAVIAREGRPYVDPALRALAAASVPATARCRVALLTIPVVRAVVASLEAAATGWTRHALAGLGAQPYFAADVDARVVNYIVNRRRVTGLAEGRRHSIGCWTKPAPPKRQPSGRTSGGRIVTAQPRSDSVP